MGGLEGARPAPTTLELALQGRRRPQEVKSMGPLGGARGSGTPWTQSSTSPEHTLGKNDELMSLTTESPLRP